VYYLLCCKHNNKQLTVTTLGGIMGEVIEIFVLMLLVASLAFAPLGYFIYLYVKKNSDPFAGSAAHGDTKPSLIDEWVNKIMGRVTGALSKK
jgi:hypothetical protein